MSEAQALKSVMEDLIAKELTRRASEADLVVFTLHDPADAEEPLYYRLFDREASDGEIQLEVDFGYEGIGVWYLCRREGETFTAKKVLLQIASGRFVNGQIGDFEGFWDDFPHYVAEDRWVAAACARHAANEH